LYQDKGIEFIKKEKIIIRFPFHLEKGREREYIENNKNI